MNYVACHLNINVMGLLNVEMLMIEVMKIRAMVVEMVSDFVTVPSLASTKSAKVDAWMD